MLIICGEHKAPMNCDNCGRDMTGDDLKQDINFIVNKKRIICLLGKRNSYLHFCVRKCMWEYVGKGGKK